MSLVNRELIVKGKRVEVKKAVSRDEMNNRRRGDGGPWSGSGGGNFGPNSGNGNSEFTTH